MDIIKDDYKTLVDRIVYLASLVSEARSVDPMLNKLRQITSRWLGGGKPQESERTTLMHLESDLKDYLIHRDPLRSFTPETLEARLHNFETGGAADRNRRNFILMLLVSLASLVIGFAIAPAHLPIANRMALALPIYMVIITIGITWFSLSGLGNFKPGVRKAFIYLCISWVFMSIELVHYGVIQLFDLQQYPLFRYAGLTILVTMWMLFVFLGMRTYAGLLNIRTRFNSWKWVSGFSALLVLLAVFAPHPRPVPDEFYFRLALACVVPGIAFGIFSSILGHKIRRITRTKPMTILAYYLTIVTVNLIGGILALFMVGTLSKEVLAVIIGTGCLPQIALLYTAYLFKKETDK